VKLGDYLGQRPVVLVLAYFRCTMLCNEVLRGLVENLPRTGLSPDQYELVVVSFDADDGPELAAATRSHYLEECGRPGMAAHVHFLPGPRTSIEAITRAVGFGYAYDARTNQYAPPGMVTILTPGGTIARYLFGIRFPPRDLRLALVEASEGKVGSLA